MGSGIFKTLMKLTPSGDVTIQRVNWAKGALGWESMECGGSEGLKCDQKSCMSGGVVHQDSGRCQYTVYVRISVALMQLIDHFLCKELDSEMEGSCEWAHFEIIHAAAEHVACEIRQHLEDIHDVVLSDVEVISGAPVVYLNHEVSTLTKVVSSFKLTVTGGSFMMQSVIDSKLMNNISAFMYRDQNYPIAGGECDCWTGGPLDECCYELPSPACNQENGQCGQDYGCISVDQQDVKHPCTTGMAPLNKRATYLPSAQCQANNWGVARTMPEGHIPYFVILTIVPLYRM